MSDEIVVRKKAVEGTIIRSWPPATGLDPGELAAWQLHNLADLIDQGVITCTLVSMADCRPDHRIPYLELDIQVRPKG